MNKKGFTLSEMLIVLVIISSLMYLIIPNLTESMKKAEESSCDSYKQLVQSQIEAYKMDTGIDVTSIDVLVTNNYIKSNTCPNGDLLTIIDGLVTEDTTTLTP
ncbi:competence type IV pilus major pilin ComGC [Haloplasma contractile]|uniref:Bacterial type II secretion-trafficking system protein n=1 Tax=Haloplasma contractile SSD-17B TaxID=1033810 RepID=U2E030_9MOLU|nr:competence type IV pilus major pilin ComGC [Haloplasma contractile]ERJ13787.1 Bacterial type II secretion-trafficking system protein [Haloplasma contractile SSD-17B]